MTTTWYLVRHVPDLRRKEPRNVGVILDSPDGWYSRFLGEDDSGDIEARQLRSYRDINLDVYRTWVSYFKRKASDDRWRDVERLQAKRRSNYYAEIGGQEFDAHESTRALLERLYLDLVVPVGSAIDGLPSATASHPGIADRLKDGARRIFREVGVAPIEDAQVSGKFGERSIPLYFGFRYDNGQPHLMDIAVRRSRPDLAAADARELNARIVGARDANVASSFLAFYSSADFPASRIDEIIIPLEEVAHCIDLSGGKEAEETFAHVTHALDSGDS